MKISLHHESVIKERRGNTSVTYDKGSTWSVTRYLTDSGWSNTGKDRKPDPICGSFVHPSVAKWDRARELLDRIQLGDRIEIRKVRREIIWDDYSCIEEKLVNYVTVNGRDFAFTGDPMDIPSVLEFLKEESGFRHTVFFAEKGRVLLDPEATSHLLKSLMAMLMADSPLLNKDERGLPDITLYDDPLIAYSHAYYTFDDEGVKTERKELVGNGQVLNYLGTLYTGAPGNGRGMYPKPDFFNAVLKPGDWKLRELMEESKNALMVLGATQSEIVKKSIRIRPRRVIQLGGGEILVREIAIPFSELSTLDAITSDTRLVYLDEDHGAVAPFVRMTARLLI
ncbi:hypothetical protein L3N51_00555 [Metallosphaera sp. J1]|uniref:metallopeptidase TldD-related protein n=1 Tax=Metallosphaera javensis (ex Hofmann et al. 2022) TaxID=99938 RepID=UPI001EE0B306|nr:metallopeptidase TldD-related protein [Metallosphaera javensis (ex Hofmann et al. 2022)]MCG3108274.1 hypothetical protein [Metallosphaera javensis (ex Hofmann et al. 2022)]